MSEAIIVSLCSGALLGTIFGFIQFLLTRKDEKLKEKNAKDTEDIKNMISSCESAVTEKVTEVRENLEQFSKTTEERFLRTEKDSCRTQLLLLMDADSENISEIMKVAEHYFKDLHGDWYMTPKFTKWLKKNDLGSPEWFIGD